jgi:hypothetical protein
MLKTERFRGSGLLEKTWGSGTYPVCYEFDSYGRQTKQHTYRGGTGWTGSTWPASPSTADTTEWFSTRNRGAGSAGLLPARC